MKRFIHRALLGIHVGGILLHSQALNLDAQLCSNSLIEYCTMLMILHDVLENGRYKPVSRVDVYHLA